MSDETRPYRVIYNDGSYLDYDLTEEEYKRLCDFTAKNMYYFKYTYGMLRLQDIRSIIIPRAPEGEDSGQASPDAPHEWIRWEQEQREKEVDEDIDY